ncbi:hypothetical protein SDC9_117158 [bioreactor metagenome]|uniref:Uncharacterized protein n=1 Tax=bioreactor metagenome TaxID=1076179 RepID=A0A645BY71_9ZZZZ
MVYTSKAAGAPFTVIDAFVAYAFFFSMIVGDSGFVGCVGVTAL